MSAASRCPPSFMLFFYGSVGGVSYPWMCLTCQSDLSVFSFQAEYLQRPNFVALTPSCFFFAGCIAPNGILREWKEPETQFGRTSHEEQATEERTTL